MPAPVVRRRSARSCTRTVQPRCASAQAAVSPAKPAPAISAWRFLVIGCCARLHLEVTSASHCLMIDLQRRNSLAGMELLMARLRHFAVCVKDLEKAAKFYENVFELERVGREDLDIGSAIYM